MKIFVVDVSDYDDHLIIADNEKEALEIYFKQFPRFTGNTAHLNPTVRIHQTIPIQKGFIYSAYLGG